MAMDPFKEEKLNNVIRRLFALGAPKAGKFLAMQKTRSLQNEKHSLCKCNFSMETTIALPLLALDGSDHPLGSQH